MNDAAKAGLIDPKAVLNAVHNSIVFGRRVRVISQHLARAIPEGGRVLDFGSGDGSIALALSRIRPDLEVEGVDVMIRRTTHIPITKFDGRTLPFDDDSFDYVTIVDVLHHTEDPASVLAEASRVASKGVVIKDHVQRGFGAKLTLQLMDWVGNRGHDVVLPYNYFTQSDWDAALLHAGLSRVTWLDQLGIYPASASFLFDRRLHFVSLMAPMADRVSFDKSNTPAE